MLSEIQSSVERLFKDGKPLHHLDSARALEYDPQASHFFVTSAESFDKLEAKEVQNIFRNRHILIPGSASEEYIKFDHRGLATVGSLHVERDIQGDFFYLNFWSWLNPFFIVCS